MNLKETKSYWERCSFRVYSVKIINAISSIKFSKIVSLPEGIVLWQYSQHVFIFDCPSFEKSEKRKCIITKVSDFCLNYFLTNCNW